MGLDSRNIIVHVEKITTIEIYEKMERGDFENLRLNIKKILIAISLDAHDIDLLLRSESLYPRQKML